MTKLETDEERKFVKAAYDIGCKAIKFVDPASRNAPDRMVLCPGGRVIFFEFKVPGKSSRRGQKKYQRGLEGMYFEVHEVTTCAHAMRLLKRFLCVS
jgi:hypothetical protein